jgi:hypothetical protein
MSAARRPPDAAARVPTARRQQKHYILDERRGSVQADWMLGGSLLLRRTMLEELGGYDAGFRMPARRSTSATAPRRRSWERWYVPQAVVRHR